LDRVWLALAALLAVLGLADPRQAGASLVFMADSFLWIAPFLLLSVLLAAWLKAAGVDRFVGRVGAGAPLAAILLAALIGALSPFCSCGVVPLVAALLVVGVPLPAVMAFWVSSPLMDPEQFVLMAATLGLGFTLAKTIAAVAMGLLAGLATLAVQRAGGFGAPLRAGLGGGCKSDVSEAAEPRWAIWRDPARRRDFTVEALRVAEFLAKWLLLAFAIESLMVAWLPPGLIAEHLGGSGWQAIPLSVALGVPAYPARRRADEHGHDAGRGARLPHRRRGHQHPRGHGGLRAGQAAGLPLVPGDRARRLLGLRLPLSGRADALSGPCAPP
jgi:uncharacterized membrane protein YraQ (UPF0718 family)